MLNIAEDFKNQWSTMGIRVRRCPTVSWSHCSPVVFRGSLTWHPSISAHKDLQSLGYLLMASQPLHPTFLPHQWWASANRLQRAWHRFRLDDILMFIAINTPITYCIIPKPAFVLALNLNVETWMATGNWCLNPIVISKFKIAPIVFWPTNNRWRWTRKGVAGLQT
jgi:hypothetical protein